MPLIYFFRRRVVEESTARADAQAILKGCQLVTLSQTLLDHALVAAGQDFEGNIQLASAESISVDHLITRNKKDFATAALSVLNPPEWLALQDVVILEAKLTPKQTT